MFNSVALDVVIGLVFVYLLYSLLGTLIQEIIATKIGLRAVVLKQAIGRMLDDDGLAMLKKQSDLADTIKKIEEVQKSIENVRKDFKAENILENDRSELEENISSLKSELKELENHKTAQEADIDKSKTKTPLSQAFYNHPLIKYLAADDAFLKNIPSYIDPATFSKVVIDLLRGQDIVIGSSDRQLIQSSLTHKRIEWDKKVKIEPETLLYLKSIWADSQGDVIKFKASLEQWFNEMMDRATGWYKKYTQLILLAIGLVIAGSFNVDTIKIIRILEKNPAIRDQVLAQANAFSKEHKDLDVQIAQQEAKINSFGKPRSKDSIAKLGAEKKGLDQKRASKALGDTLFSQANHLVGKDINKVNSVLSIGWNGGFCKNFGLTSLLGWVLTALAISMGAPFWFDLLNKLMQLKSSIAPKDDSKANAGTTTTPKNIVG